MLQESLQYPIGRFVLPNEITDGMKETYMQDISDFPRKIEKVLEHLLDFQLEVPYREGGWTIRQVVHHCADSHMNALIRFKLALTEHNPTIKPYLEAAWAELEDVKLPISVSLQILHGVHTRWSYLLKNLSDEAFQRRFIHPDNKTQYQLIETLSLYAWHCNHHLAHVTELIKRERW